MDNLEVTFELSPWEAYLEELSDRKISAAEFLALMEGESEEALEDAFADLEEVSVALDVSDLPKGNGTGEAALRLRREQELVKQGNLYASLEKNDPLKIYLRELAAIPVCGDVRILSEQVAEANRTGKSCDSARNMLMNLSLSRVVELAGEYTGYGVLLLDLIQEGSLGLLQGTAGFIGENFEDCRDWWIRQYMAKAIIMQARESGVGRKMRDAMEDYRAVDERLLAELGRNATIEEIAEQMHVSPEEALAAKKMIDNARMLKQAKNAAEPEEEEQEAEEEAHVEDTALFQMRQRIMDLLSGLSEADAKLLTLRFGLEGGMPLNPEETGRRLGLTPEEVVAREAAALAQLRRG